EAALASFIGLRPKMDNFIHDSGESLILMALHGTLPVSFRGVVYNIPVAVWVPLTYPRHPPIAFVTPTANMLVRAGRHVDLAGRVYHPILANWHNMPSAVCVITKRKSYFGYQTPIQKKNTGCLPDKLAIRPSNCIRSGTTRIC
ncbi:UEV domain-containing protein, partial [Obelidium mucronatum]